MTTTLELTKDALRRHLALEVLDRTLDTFFADLNLDRLALNRFTNAHKDRQPDMREGTRQGLIEGSGPVLEIELFQDGIGRFCTAHHVEMNARDALIEQLSTLLNRPLNTDLEHVLFVRVLEFFGQSLGDLAVERARDALELTTRRQDLETRNDGHVDARRTTRFDVAEVVAVIEKHLRHDVLGARIDLLFGAADVRFDVRRLEVLLGVARATHAKLGGRSVEVRVEILALVHGRDLFDQVFGVGVARATAGERLAVSAVIAADCEDVVDAQVAQLDEEVLGLLLREPVAEHVGNGVNVVLVLDQGADTKCSGSLALDRALNALGCFVVHHLSRMAGDVDEGRVVLHQIVDHRHQVADVAAALGRDELETDERALCLGEVFSDLHDPGGSIAPSSDPATRRACLGLGLGKTLAPTFLESLRGKRKRKRKGLAVAVRVARCSKRPFPLPIPLP